MYKKILVAIDDSETSRSALAEALHIARTSSAKLYICHVVDETLMNMQGRVFTSELNVEHAITTLTGAGHQLLDEVMKSAAGIEAEAVLLEARNRRVSEILDEKARELGVDLIIVGRHGRRGLATLILGSVAEQLAKMSKASVLLVRKH
jgi:nucleotide-binding universal stress UspA family protein